MTKKFPSQVEEGMDTTSLKEEALAGLLDPASLWRVFTFVTIESHANFDMSTKKWKSRG